MNLTVKVSRKVHGESDVEFDIFQACRVKISELSDGGLSLDFIPAKTAETMDVDVPWKQYVFTYEKYYAYTVYIENEAGNTSHVARTRFN